MLDEYSSSAVKAMLAEWVGKKAAAKGHKTDFIEQLSAYLSDKAQVKAFIAALDGDGVTMIAQADALSKESLTVASLVFAVQGQGLRHVEKTLRRMLRSGLILAQREGYGNRFELADIMNNSQQRLLLVPAAVRQAKAPRVRRESLPPVPARKIGTIHRGAPAQLIGGLVNLARYARERKVKVTKDGWVATNLMARIQRESGLDVADVPASLLVEIGLAGEVIGVSDGLVRPASRSRALLTDPLGTTIRMLFDAFVAKSGWPDDSPPGSPDEVHRFFREPPFGAPLPDAFRIARAFLASVLRRIETTDWMDIEAFADLALQINPSLLLVPDGNYRMSARQGGPFMLTRDAYKLAVQREYIRCCIARTFVIFGLVEIGEIGNRKTPHQFHRPEGNSTYWHNFRGEYDDVIGLGDGKPRPLWRPTPCYMAFRVTALGREVLWGERAAKRPEQATITIGADFEIIASRDQTPPEVLLQLETLARAIKGHPTDPVRRYRLEKESLIGALKAGVDLETTLAALEAHAGRPLPKNVGRTLRDWSRAYGAIELYLGCDLLELDSEAERVQYQEGDTAKSTGSQLRGAELVGNRYMLLPRLSPRDVSTHTVIDYERPDQACITVGRDRVIRVLREQADFLIDRELAMFSHPVSPIDGPGGDQADEFRLTRDSVAHSRYSAEIILRVLAERSTHKLPEEIELAILGWSGQIQPLAAGTLTVLRVGEPRVVAGILDCEELRQCLAGTLAEGVLVVKEHRLEELTSKLEQRGIEVSNTLAVLLRQI